MEDGSNSQLSTPVPSQPVTRDEPMATHTIAEIDESKVNGDSYVDRSDEDDSDSSDFDTLFIEESVDSDINKTNKLRTRGFRGFKNNSNSNDNFAHSNPYFSESIFDLLEKSRQETKKTSYELQNTKVTINDNANGDRKVNWTNDRLKQVFRKGKGSPKLREYAQYLGLQPTVQFKCSRCSTAGFPSLAVLNEHLLDCNESAPASELAFGTNSGTSSTNIRVTRRVFLCSACGTYYENWNLFLHMREVHRRYICLYCLGMFSHPEKLSLHIVSKHNSVPAYMDTLDEFRTLNKEPCFLMCCECQMGFTERDNVFGHTCPEGIKKNPQKQSPKFDGRVGLNNVGHVTGDKTQASVLVKTSLSNSNHDRCDDDTTENVKPTFDCLKVENPAVDEFMKPESHSQDEPESDDTQSDRQENDGSISSSSGLTDRDEPTINLQEPDQDVEDGDIEDRDMLATDDEDDASQDDLENNITPDGRNDRKTSQDDEEMSVESFDVEEEEEGEDTRKVPKVTLKIPKNFDQLDNDEYDHPDYDSDDSEKLEMELDAVQNEIKEEGNVSQEELDVEHADDSEGQIQVAGPDISIVELELEQPLDKFDIKVLIQKCLKETIPTCVYCNHARKICVNGKQLGLHTISEHRFSAIVNSITAEELIPESFVTRIRDSLPELDGVFFNLESNVSEEGITFSHVFECFQCRYSTNVHKELYLHNRKMHAKSILLCIMCKSNFYSYSELICHLCPGIYEMNADIHFRCCMCVSDELSSAFRLMVHLRKRHHACDVCLELCNNQAKLSNHVWKHKLHHLCYRCGIAYRNKPDITKHLFWKHGTESVLCKKCLQKKWPHVYHFCIPPLNFSCEECNQVFTRAIALMVHKRLHTNEMPHACTWEGCEERFISKKLMVKHEFKHREPLEDHSQLNEEVVKQEDELSTEVEKPIKVEATTDEIECEEKTEKGKLKVDVYDLPELKLSESDSSDSDEYVNRNVRSDLCSTESKTEIVDDSDEVKVFAELERFVPVMETIWDDFRNYQANKDKLDNGGGFRDQSLIHRANLEDIMKDHDYCVDDTPVKECNEQDTAVDMSVDHDYCYGKDTETEVKTVQKSPEKKHTGSHSSASSSDSDSSSCTCGSNCSCSSTTGSNSTSDSSDSNSSSSESRRRQQAKRERRKLKTKNKDKESSKPISEVKSLPVTTIDTPVQESDLDTTETETDEDFYDEQPQKLANKLIAERKNQLLQMVNTNYANGSLVGDCRPTVPQLPDEEVKLKKKSKSKKRKKKNKSYKYETENPNNMSNFEPHHTPDISLVTLNQAITTPIVSYSPNANSSISGTVSEVDSHLRSSKRKRVPNKFYGYSSDEEQDKLPQPPVLKWRKSDLPSPRSPLTVPPITIKAMPPPVPTTVGEIPQATIIPKYRLPSPVNRPQHSHPKMKPLMVLQQQQDSASDSNDSSSEGEQRTVKEQQALYCYCRCPYDEVSEMIGCDSPDCLIEWFHFECVGIMVPPKGQWFCPDCRKKKQQRREALQGNT